MSGRSRRTATETSLLSSNIAMAYSPRPKSRLPRLLLIIPVALAVLLFVRGVPHFGSRLPRASIPSDPPPPVNSSRIAVCYAGHVGTLTKVFRQNERVLSELSSIPPAHFFVVDLHDDYLDPESGRQVMRTHEIGDVQPVFDALRARAVQTISLSELVGSNAPSECAKDADRETRPTAGEHFGEAYARFVAMRRCFDLVVKEEAEKDQRFHYILVMRPDMHIKVQLPRPEMPVRVHMSGAGMVLVPRPWGEYFFSIVDAFDKDYCRELERMNEEPCKKYSYGKDSTECLLIKWLEREGMVPSNSVLVSRRIIYPSEV